MSNITTQRTIQEICFEDGVRSVIHLFMLLSLICSVRSRDNGEIKGTALGELYRIAFKMYDNGVDPRTINSMIYLMHARISQSCYN